MEPQINCEVVYFQTILTPKVACCLPSVFEFTLKICKYPQDPSSISFFFRQTDFHDQTDTGNPSLLKCGALCKRNSLPKLGVKILGLGNSDPNYTNKPVVSVAE